MHTCAATWGNDGDDGHARSGEQDAQQRLAAHGTIHNTTHTYAHMRSYMGAMTGALDVGQQGAQQRLAALKKVGGPGMAGGAAARGQWGGSKAWGCCGPEVPS